MTHKPPKSTRRRTTVTAASRREEILRYALMLTPVGEIAKRLDLDRSRVSDILAEPEVAAKLARARATAFEDAIASLRVSTRRAAAKLDALIDSDDESVALRASVELLRLAGADAPKKLNIGVVSAASDSELEAEALRLLDERRRLGVAVASAVLEVVPDGE